MVIQNLEQCDDKYHCILDIGNAIKVQWDTMYYFSGASSLEEINSVLGFELKQYTDVGPRVIILKGNKVVYHEEWFRDPESNKKDIIFNTDNKYFKLGRAEAKFKIEDGGNAYVLKKE